MLPGLLLSLLLLRYHEKSNPVVHTYCFVLLNYQAQAVVRQAQGLDVEMALDHVDS